MYTNIRNIFKIHKKRGQDDVEAAQSNGLFELYDTSRHYHTSSELDPQPGPSNAPRVFDFLPVELRSKSRVQYPNTKEDPQKRSAITDPVVAPGCPAGGICREGEGMLDAYRRKGKPMSPLKRNPKAPRYPYEDQPRVQRYDQDPPERRSRAPKYPDEESPRVSKYDQEIPKASRYDRGNPAVSEYDQTPCNSYARSPRERGSYRQRDPMYQPGSPMNCLPSDVCNEEPKISEARKMNRRYPTAVQEHTLPEQPTAERKIEHNGPDLPVPAPIATDRNLLKEVAEFYHQFPDLHTEVRIMVSNNITIYLLGTNHADPQCPIDVSNIVRKIQPQAVLIELCAWRACGCKDHVGNIFQTKPEFSFRYLRKVITQIGFLPAMIFFTDAFNEHTASERGQFMDYGAEFAVAAQACNELSDCKIVLADREIPITVKRQASAMGNWRGLKVTMLVTLSLLLKSRMKNFLLRGHRAVIRDPHFYQIVVLERDIFLTYMIQAAASLPFPQERPKIVAVVGQGHLNGIQSFWGRVVPQVLPLILKSDIDM